MTNGESMGLFCFIRGFCSAFFCLGVAWSMVDAVRAWRPGGES
jgi:hypothetical protein